MRVLIFGATGMLGQALLPEAAARGLGIVTAGRGAADITCDMANGTAVGDAVRASHADVVLNAAAWTDVSACETDPTLAYAVNARAVAFMADACRETGARIVQISTDQFYAGDGDLAHTEDARVTWMASEYARTKFAGEGYALAAPGGLVLRTNITGLRGLAGSPTFIEWAFRTAEAGERFRLFDDYFTSTIDTGAFAKACLDLTEARAEGLLNVASREVSSKRDFVVAAVTALLGEMPDHDVASVRALGVARADSAGLNVGRAEQALGYELPGLDAVVTSLVDAWKKRSEP